MIRSLRASRTLMGLAWCSIIAGGLIAAVTDPLDLEHGSWASAYLVLVGGVAQYAIGLARDTRDGTADRRGWTQVVVWNAANALVLLGVQADRPILVDVGSALLLAAIAIALFDAAAERGLRSTQLANHVWLRRGFVALLVFVGASIPVGIVLAHQSR